MNITDFLRPDTWLEKNRGPRYVQLCHWLQEGIEKRIIPPGSSLPPEREIAEITDLSRVTVRKAIRELVKKGSIEQRQGVGSFVRMPVPKVEQSLSFLTSFTEDMQRRGYETTSKWLERGVFMPAPDETVALGLSSHESVARIYRLREAGGQPMALEKATLSLAILPDPMEVTTSLYDVLDRYGNRPIRAIQNISAVNLLATEADLLGVAEGTAGLRIRRLSYLKTNRVVEFTRSLYRGDAYDFVAELRLST